jgi:hypothetical protein
VVAALATIAAVAPTSAGAQDARMVKRVEDLNRAALEDYDLLEFESARKQLGDALALIKKHRLDRHRVAARTHMNLAIVHGGGLGDQDTALLELIAALEVDPEIKLDPAYKSPALHKTFEQARASVGGRSGSGGESEAAPPPLAGSLTHAPVDEARAGEALPITVKVGGEIAERATQLVLRYRASGDETFASSHLRAAGGGEYQGLIPEAATHGDSVHYFVEARAATGKVLATAGSVDAPHIVSFVRPVAAAGQAELPADEENPLARAAPPAGGGTGGGDGETEVATRAPARRRFFVSVGVGAGVGYISSGETEVSHQAVTCCLAPAPFHLMPEVGYRLAPRLALSLLGRIGFPLGADVAGAATLAPAVFGRVSYRFGDEGGAYVHGDVGGGYIRHTIALSASSASMNMGSTDTFVTGPLLIGAGGGWIQPLGKGPLRFVVDVNVIAGIPIIDQIGSGARASEPGFALHADLSLGLGLAF